MSTARRSLSLLLLTLALVFAARAAPAQTPAPSPMSPAAPAPDSWAGQLDTLVRWAERNRGPRACESRCFALQRLRLTGSLDPGPLQFELEGAVLADGPVAVPLFGPADKVRVENVTEDQRPAAVSFDEHAYFVYTAARRFVLRGTLTFRDDLALTIPGPLNTLDAELTGARVVEGAHLAGLRDTTVHFDRGAAEASPQGPTVFQLSHAVRVGREIGFTWKLVLQSGADLGVVRLPLRFGERVLDVTGSTGWRVDGTELLLPSSGRQAEVTVTGTLPRVVTFTPDPRSEYEWWLIESDAEHRVTVGGDARQMDSAESPIPRTQPSARLYLVQRGQRIEPTVQTLTSVEALAAVVHSHDRTVVLTRQGDVVSDDSLRYENNGIDYLLYDARGRPIFLSTDGTAERIMHRGGEARDILVPLRTGSHLARVQAIQHVALAPLGGWLRIETPTHPLTTSRVSMTLGLPRGVIPLAVLGGEESRWAVDTGDLVALGVALVAAWLAFRTNRRRALGAVSLAGLWFVAPGGFVAAVGLMACAGALWLAGRLFTGPARVLANLAAVGGAVVALLVAVAFSQSFARRAPSTADMRNTALEEGAVNSRDEGGSGWRGPLGRVSSAGDLGNMMAQSAAGGVLQGVTPVALTLPGYDHAVTLRRELVTRERPFRPAVFYVTSLALMPVIALWLVCIGALVWSHRRELEALRERVRERIATGAEKAARPNEPAAPRAADEAQKPE